MRAGRLVWLAAAVAVAHGVPGVVRAADDVHMSITPVGRYVDVSGDAEKWRAHHWTKDGAVAGIKEFEASYGSADDLLFLTEGHALLDANDYSTEMLLRKADLGFVEFEFEEFRKYFDGTGGSYYRFGPLNTNDTERDLTLDIGKFGVATGLTLENLPDLTFKYEREYKDGTKSRLTWGGVKVGGVTRKILPTWQDVDEVVDAFELSADHEIAGFSLGAEQRVEFVRIEALRQERNIATTSTASDFKVRTQDVAPEANVYTTTLHGERRFWEEKAFFAAGYHFAHMNNREFETLRETNVNGIPTNFSHPEQKPNNRADIDFDSHTWVGNFTVSPVSWLTVGSRLKSELIAQEGSSSYNADVGPESSGGSTPNGVLDRVDFSQTENRATRWGEQLSIRYTGIPRTALYTEVELEQARVRMDEDRQSIDGPDAGDDSSAGEIFNRFTVTDVRRGAFTVGGQAVPVGPLTVTAHVRHRRNTNDYDDQRETFAATNARSAFIDGQRLESNEVMTRWTLHPARWVRGSFRFQLQDQNYTTWVENEAPVDTDMVSRVYTYDLTVTPRSDFSATGSYSHQNAWTVTPAANALTANTPQFDADVDTILLTTSYLPAPRVDFVNSVQYSWAQNFNDFQGLPLGADFKRTDFTSGVTWRPQDDLSVGAEYGFYRYTSDKRAEVGDYNAHMIWLEVTREF